MGEAIFSHPVVVRYSEVDAQGVVFNMWYLGWFDEAMTAFLAARGLPYQRMLDAGFDVQLVRCEIDYRSGVRWQDEIAIDVTPASFGNTSFVLEFGVRRGAEYTTRGRTVYVVVATDGSGKRPIPALLADALGEPRPLSETP